MHITAKPILDMLWKIKPVEKRSALGRFKINQAETRFDDVYICYLFTRTSFFACLFLDILCIFSRTIGLPINLYFFSFDFSGAGYVREFLNFFSEYASAIVLLVVLPYYIILLGLYANPRTHVSSWKEPHASIGKEERRPKYGLLAANAIILPLCMYGSFALFTIFMGKYHLENSYPYFLFCGLTLSGVLPMIGLLFLLLVVVPLWRAFGGD